MISAVLEQGQILNHIQLVLTEGWMKVMAE